MREITNTRREEASDADLEQVRAGAVSDDNLESIAGGAISDDSLGAIAGGGLSGNVRLEPAPETHSYIGTVPPVKYGIETPP